MGMYAVQAADAGELAASRDAARHGRAAAVSRRRALAAGRSALTPAQERVRTGLREAEVRAPASANGAPPTAGAERAGTEAEPAAETQPVVEPRPAPEGRGATSSALASAQSGRDLSMQRRRRLSQGKQALAGAGDEAATPTSNGARPAPEASAGASSDALASAQSGRDLSMQRRRRLSLGKQALTAGGHQAAATPASNGAAPVPGGEQAGAGGSCREQARARRAAASRHGSAGISRPQSEGRIEHAPKVLASPTHGGQRVTGLRIGPGVQVTGDEAGAELRVSGTQYVGAGGSAPAPGGGPKVGLVRTPRGLVVSGTTVRNKVAITGDEFGEHLPITGEAEPKLDDDLTPRPSGAYAPAQFPRRADPHGATAVGTRLGARSRRAAPRGAERLHAVETTTGGHMVSGTAVGRSARVTGDEAGACRTITGDQYQALAPSSSECGGTGGGTAPAGYLDLARRDPATLGKVTEAQTWAGQLVTGPSVEHRPNVTGDEPGSCRPVTGTPYQGPSTAFGWCESEDGQGAAARLDTRPAGTAVTGDVPMHADAVTGTERGRGKAVTGTPYYDDLRDAEPAAEDWAYGRAFPVALARRQARVRVEGDGADEPESDAAPVARTAAVASTVPGRITGSFAISREKVTGNTEFLFRPRPDHRGRQPVVTGEGGTDGPAITGSAWTVHDRVTGTEGYIAAGRNPSEGGGSSHAWAGAGRFGVHAKPGVARQIVTGRSGSTDNAAARVTLSGGAQG